MDFFEKSVRFKNTDKGRAQHGITDNLEQLLVKAEKDSAAVFNDVLTHKEKADKIRNSLAVLQRFKLLFHLPGRVHRCRTGLSYVTKKNQFKFLT